MEIEKKIIEEGFEVAKSFLKKLINPPLEELGLFVADNIKYWRFKNQIKILKKAEEYVRNNNIEIKQIPLKVLIPLLEGASLEEDNDLRDKWSALLVNYADKNKNINCSVYPSILNQLSSNEARCLNEMLERETYSDVEFYNLWNKYELNWVNISNLKRLGLIETMRDMYTSEPEYDEDGSFQQRIYTDGENEFNLTFLGKDFIKACQLDNNKNILQ